MKFKLTATQKRIIAAIENVSCTTWVTGGAVRDQIRGVEPKDIDFVTNCCHLRLENVLQKEGLTVIPDQTAKQHGIIRVVDKDTGELIDIARLRKDCQTDGRHAIVEFTDVLKEDLARRDFTWNAMACQIDSSGEIINEIDLFNGCSHLQERVVHFIGNMHDRIREDYLRMIRLCRFTALGPDWKLGPPPSQVRIHANNITKISKERIRDEILKALMYPKPSNFFRNLDACGLLRYIMPALADTIGVEQNQEHAEDVWNHCLRSLDASVELTDKPMLRLAALLHDVGKPPSKTTDEKGIHFYSHEIIGTSIVYEWMKEHKFSKEDIEYVTLMIRHHMFRFTDNSTDKAVKKWLNKIGIHQWRDLITLRMCDRKGNLTKAHKPLVTKKMYDLMQTIQRILDHKEPTSRKDLAISGHDLIAMEYKPGKIFQEILDELVELILEDPANNTREILVKYVRENYKLHKTEYSK